MTAEDAVAHDRMTARAARAYHDAKTRLAEAEGHLKQAEHAVKNAAQVAPWTLHPDGTMRGQGILDLPEWPSSADVFRLVTERDAALLAFDQARLDLRNLGIALD